MSISKSIEKPAYPRLFGLVLLVFFFFAGYGWHAFSSHCPNLNPPTFTNCTLYEHLYIKQVPYNITQINKDGNWFRITIGKTAIETSLREDMALLYCDQGGLFVAQVD